MTVVGEEGTPIEDFTAMLKTEFLDSAFLQQNAFDDVDAATSVDRQRFVFDKILEILHADFTFANKDEARRTFKKISSMFINWNYAPWDDSVVPGDERQDEPMGEAARGDKDTERGDFKTILGQIDQYVQSLLTGDSSEAKEELEEAAA